MVFKLRYNVYHCHKSGCNSVITDLKLYVPVVNLSIQYKLLQQLILGFKRTISWIKYESKVQTEAQDQFLDFQVDLNFQGVNRLFVLLFEDNADQTS